MKLLSAAILGIPLWTLGGCAGGEAAGSVADVMVPAADGAPIDMRLDGMTRALANPTGLLPFPERGYQVSVGPFTVPPGQEKTMCAFVVLGNEEASSLNRIQTAMSAGSHHMNLYLALAEIDKEGTTACGSDTMGQLIVFGAQQAEHDVVLPAGIGYPLPAGQQVILEAHYINPTLEPVEALGVANIHLAEEGEIKEHAGIMALFPDNIFVPAGGAATVTSRCLVPFDAEIVIMMSHMHRFGQYFEAYHVDPSTSPETRNLVYTNEDWHTPEYKQLSEGNFLDVAAGDLIEFSCHYQNETDSAVTGGPSAETNEMCIFGAGYVPYHGFLLCQQSGAVCPDEPVNPEIDPMSSVCAHYLDCMLRCGDFGVGCSNCCTPGMDVPCMMCMQGLLGCASQSGCAGGFLDFDMNCILGACSEEFDQCFVEPVAE